MASKTTADDINLPQLRDHLVRIALSAGSMITSATPTTSASGTKKNSADLVTETDQAVEAFVSSELKRLYPNFSFMGEETYVPGQKLGPEPTFIVDPIDGTTNFVHRYPYVSVSLGFAVNKAPTVGVVYNPFTGALYSGIRGQGSYVKNVASGASKSTGSGTDLDPSDLGQRLPLKPLEPLGALDSCIVVIEFGSDRSGQNWKNKCETWARLGRSKDEGGAMVHSARALGSAALNMCAVAEGTLDLYWEGGCWAWDVCAAWVILTEAGGIVVDANPGGWDIPVDHRKYLAVKGATSGQRELVEEFWRNVEGTLEYEH
ncbi:Inositol monophosphatase 2 [Exophiala dermatitidis]